MNSLEKVTALLDSYCTSKTAQATTIDPRYAQLWQEIHRYVMGGGKRMRPRLVLLANEAYGGPTNDGVISVAAAWELLHACLLVHDDIIDRDTVRHGQPNIAGVYQSTYGQLTDADSEHYALSAALLGGDLLLMSAYEIITESELSSTDKITALSYINKALFAVAGGELIDTDSALYPISESNPYSVAAHKTASYSLQLPLQCGAALAGASDGELERLSEIGLHIGVAYQLRDDLLGVFGDSQSTGKSNRSDIIEKKRTFLVQKTIESLDEADSSRLVDLYSPSHQVSDSQAEEIVQLITASGAKQATEEAIEIETKKALEGVNNLSVSTNYKETFTKIASSLTTRTS